MGHTNRRQPGEDRALRADESARSGVQSIDRAAALLRCFARHRPTLGASELARLTGLTTSTTHRLLTALQVNGLVQQVEGRRYQLGPLLLRLAQSVHSRLDLRELALPTMRELRDETDETVGLHVLLPNNTRAVIDQVESNQPLRRTYTELGEPIPLNQGAPGKVLLAYLSGHDLDDVLARPMHPATKTTPVNPEALRAELATIRERGYAISLAERVPGIHTVAFPIKDHTGRVMASLSITGPEARMPEERLHAIGGTARARVRRISAALGGEAAP